MTKETSVAMIGCGFFAQNHLHGWKDMRSEGVRLAAVCDIDPSKAEAAAKSFGAKAYTDPVTMMDEVKPNLVDIATRMDTHRALCAAAGERGIAAIVQKPLAPSWADCVAIADTAHRQNAFLAVHENFRFEEAMLRVKAAINEGLIGTPSWARISFRTGYNVYANQPYFYDEDRLAILDVGIHVLDLARVFLGEAERVSCETQRRNPKVKAEDTATMMLRHETGAVSIVECTYEARIDPDHFPQSMVEIEGEIGSIMVLPGERLRITSRGKTWEEDHSSPVGGWKERPWNLVQQSVYNTNAHILACFRQGRKADTDIADNMKTLGLVEAAYESATTQRSCPVPRWSAL